MNPEGDNVGVDGGGGAQHLAASSIGRAAIAHYIKALPPGSKDQRCEMQ